MKFAKELDQELVPEWRVKYLNYKAGKKYVKAVSRAINRANTTPSLRRTGDLLPPRQTPNLFSNGSPFSQKRNGGNAASKNKAGSTAGQSQQSTPGALGRTKTVSIRSPLHESTNNDNDDDGNDGTAGERRSLTSSPVAQPQYGSIVNTSSRGRSPSVITDSSRTFELPAPALRVPSNTNEPAPPASAAKARAPASTANAMKAAVPAWVKPQRRSYSLAVEGGGGNQAGSPAPRGPNLSSPYELTPRQRIRRIFSTASPQQWPMGGSGLGAGADGSNMGDNKDDINMRALDEVRERQIEFFRFLDGELDKVEAFYKLKEQQAGERLALMREQLHEMRNRRIDEIEQARHRGEEEGDLSPNASGDEEASRSRSRLGFSNGANQQNQLENDTKTWDMYQDWIAPVRAKIFKPGPNSKALQKMPQTPRMLYQGVFGGGSGVAGAGGDGHRDYVRRPGDHDIPYRTAKRKLKLALQEFYRGLELLKSYAMLNRTAFRKLNKKYDKAVNARPPYRYMNEKVNRSWFVNSTVVDDLIVAVEDLYARYFERGNHKIAVGKLRALNKRAGDESGSAFRNGLMIGVGAVFAIQGTVDGANKLFDPDPLLSTQTSYLMQLYGGYFLMLYLFTLFCIDCRIWTINKVNYPFIFEFDPRSHLDWRQLSQFPSFFFLVFGLFIWLNFSDAANPRLFLYYPVILIGFTFVLLFFPAPALWHRSRKWFLYSHWRLFFAGLYPVEFRDFFMGDMYCSMVYSISNIELFFCLYVNSWNNPAQCNSNHSRLLGFFSTLPPIWRLLQCIRRYRDTRNIFPHLVNGGKYSMTIASYVMLSLYRIQESHSNLALFITFSTINSIYTSIWDLFMDFSLLQVGSRHFMLRDILALKRRWIYYVIMVLDPILRFSWIFYAIFTHDTQHNSICSFLVSFAEATRRGMWALVRVENEHCANVAQYKASRDVPLPYHLHELESSLDQVHHPLLQAGDDEEEDAIPSVSPADQADGTPPMGSGSTKMTGAAGGSSSIRSSKQKHQPSPQTPGTAGTSGPTSWPGEGEHGASNAAATAEEGAAGTATSTGVAGAGAAGSGGSPALGANTDFGTLRRRFTSTLGKSIGVIMAEAHKQDFEKKRKPGVDDDDAGLGAMGGPGAVDDTPSSDEEYEDDDDEHHHHHHGGLHDDEDEDDDVQDAADELQGVAQFDSRVASDAQPTVPPTSSADERTLTGLSRGMSQHSRRHNRHGHTQSGGGSSSLKRASPKP
ncbi:Xenotropic and polytropic retrovirus receptor 1 [Sporothrix bragantina]|uniref:Xenotropic and polytropic retrovirus receptor 1 n=1 Tax=Sporothrix bragantina TaxID=671064 RepID=A0ABP0BZ71_9PEZI